MCSWYVYLFKPKLILNLRVHFPMNMEDQIVTNVQTEKENSMAEIVELKTPK